MTAIVVRGDALALPLADESVDLIVTSPPYFALRSYTDGGGRYPGQVGAEETPAEFLDALWAATREMVRVLKPSGSIFVNLGDKYGRGTRATSSRQSNTRTGSVPGGRAPTGFDKSLMGLPWRYAIGCIDNLGLLLRAEIIWSKPNGLPESVRDRVRRSHEQWFHFTVQPTYFSGVDEIREPHAEVSIRRSAPHRADPGRAMREGRTTAGTAANAQTLRLAQMNNPLGKLPCSVQEVATEPLAVPDHVGVDHFAAFPTAWPKWLISGWSPRGICVECGEGRRPVVETALTVNRRGQQSQRVSSAVPGGLTGQTLGWEREARIVGYACACTPYVDRPGTGERHRNNGSHASGRNSGVDINAARPSDLGTAGRVGPLREYYLDGWTPPPVRPAVVLDPFGGTGTTALVASALGRTGISVDRSHDYSLLATWRTTDRAQRAKVLGVPKPPAELVGQADLFDTEEAS